MTKVRQSDGSRVEKDSRHLPVGRWIQTDAERYYKIKRIKENLQDRTSFYQALTGIFSIRRMCRPPSKGVVR